MGSDKPGPRGGRSGGGADAEALKSSCCKPGQINAEEPVPHSHVLRIVNGGE
jgi:hypothetical protein